VFASEEYGVALAAELGAQFVPVDPQRSIFPISAGMIRQNAFTNWEFIPANVRPYFVRRISVVATNGETVRNLAARFETIYATDYLAYHRQLSLADPTISAPGDLLAAQAASEIALRSHANRILFLETDILRLIFAADNDRLFAQLEVGSHEQLIETSRPDLVLAFSPIEAQCREQMARRGWNIRELDPESPDPEAEATSILRLMLGQSAGASE
jgi:nicotinamide riboside kinase